MTPTAWVLLAVLVMAGGLCVWAWLTGGQGPEWRQETVRHPGYHSRRNREDATQRLTPPVPEPDWIPPWERPGGEAQRLPDHQEVLKARERSPEL